MRDLVDDVIPVSDADIIAAMRLLFERAKVVVEPSGAAGLAALLSPGFSGAAGGRAGKAGRVGVILSGGNVDFQEAGLWSWFASPAAAAT